MRLDEVKILLDKNGIPYELTFEQPRDTPLKLTISNPNHPKDVNIIFCDGTENPVFYDLEFGGYWFDMFGCKEDEAGQYLIDSIQEILEGEFWIIYSKYVRKGVPFNLSALYWDSSDEEWNNMDALRKTVAKIKAPKRWWKKLAGKTEIYEIFNWTSYERIVK